MLQDLFTSVNETGFFFIYNTMVEDQTLQVHVLSYCVCSSEMDRQTKREEREKREEERKINYVSVCKTTVVRARIDPCVRVRAYAFVCVRACRICMNTRCASTHETTMNLSRRPFECVYTRILVFIPACTCTSCMHDCPCACTPLTGYPQADVTDCLSPGWISLKEHPVFDAGLLANSTSFNVPGKHAEGSAARKWPPVAAVGEDFQKDVSRCML